MEKVIYIITAVILICVLFLLGSALYDMFTPEHITREGFVIDTEYSEGAFGHNGITVVYFDDDTTFIIKDIVEIPRYKNIRISLLRFDYFDSDVKVELL